MKKKFLILSSLFFLAAVFLVFKTAKAPDVYFSGHVSIAKNLREKKQNARYVFFALYDAGLEANMPIAAYRYTMTEKELKQGRFSFKMGVNNVSFMRELNILPKNVKFKLRIQESPQVIFGGESELSKEWSPIPWGTRNLDLHF